MVGLCFHYENGLFMPKRDINFFTLNTMNDTKEWPFLFDENDLQVLTYLLSWHRPIFRRLRY